jgi:DNA polymerase-3 subunit delta
MKQPALITILSSDEPLLMMEACDTIFQQAKALGIIERNVVDVLDKFDWNNILPDNQSLSLFAESKLTDIRFTKAPNKEAQSALIEIASMASPENLFLIRFPKLDKRQKSTKWFKSLAQNASLQELWPPKPYELVSWIDTRARGLGVNLEKLACEKLAEQTEGNLLAAKQTLDKLALLYPEETIDLDRLEQVSSDNARYSLFLCLDEALAGKGDRAVKMLKKFKLEGIAPVLLINNLTREISLCQKVSLAGLKGEPPMQALAKTFLWDNKKRLISSAVQRLPLAIWQKLMIRCAYLDRMIKGQQPGDVWQELELCLWMISGQRVWGRTA